MAFIGSTTMKLISISCVPLIIIIIIIIHAYIHLYSAVIQSFRGAW